MEFPVGGSGAIVEALLRGLAKHGGRLELRAHVAEVLVEGQSDRRRAAGVRLRDGSVVKARRAVISNASMWDTLPLLPKGAVPPEWAAQSAATEQARSQPASQRSRRGRFHRQPQAGQRGQRLWLGRGPSAVLPYAPAQCFCTARLNLACAG